MIGHYTIKEAAATLGVSYSQVWHVYAYGRLPLPQRLGKMFILDEPGIESLRRHLDNALKVKDDGCRVIKGTKATDDLSTGVGTDAELHRSN